jgi:hypothetical protein
MIIDRKLLLAAGPDWIMLAKVSPAVAVKEREKTL